MVTESAIVDKRTKVTEKAKLPQVWAALRPAELRRLDAACQVLHLVSRSAFVRQAVMARIEEVEAQEQRPKFARKRPWEPVV